MEKLLLWNQKDTNADSIVFPDIYHGFHNFFTSDTRPDKRHISPAKFNPWNTTVADWHILRLKTPSTEAVRSKVPGAVWASSVILESKCGLWVIFAADILVNLDATCLHLGLHGISHLLLWTEYGGSAIHTKGITEIAIKAHTNMENGRRKMLPAEVRLCLYHITEKHGSLWSKARVSMVYHALLQHSPVFSDRFAEWTHSSVKSKADTEG